MEQTLVQLKAANAEVERIREELQPKVKNMNSLMAQVKQNYTELKKTIKGYYPQEQWADYGVPDKR
jgi:predicted  nucleic acid-binding Zn-ribbon protein